MRRWHRATGAEGGGPCCGGRRVGCLSEPFPLGVRLRTPGGVLALLAAPPRQPRQGPKAVPPHGGLVYLSCPSVTTAAQGCPSSWFAWFFLAAGVPRLCGGHCRERAGCAPPPAISMPAIRSSLFVRRRAGRLGGWVALFSGSALRALGQGSGAREKLQLCVRSWPHCAALCHAAPRCRRPWRRAVAGGHQRAGGPALPRVKPLPHRAPGTRLWPPAASVSRLAVARQIFRPCETTVRPPLAPGASSPSPLSLPSKDKSGSVRPLPPPPARRSGWRSAWWRAALRTRCSSPTRAPRPTRRPSSLRASTPRSRVGARRKNGPFCAQLQKKPAATSFASSLYLHSIAPHDACGTDLLSALGPPPLAA